MKNRNLANRPRHSMADKSGTSPRGRNRFANRLMWSLVDQGYSISFEGLPPNNGVIICVISKGKQEVSAESNNVSSALYIAFRNLKEDNHGKELEL